MQRCHSAREALYSGIIYRVCRDLNVLWGHASLKMRRNDYISDAGFTGGLDAQFQLTIARTEDADGFCQMNYASSPRKRTT